MMFLGSKVYPVEQSRMQIVYQDYEVLFLTLRPTKTEQ